jgi:hypothetical protein
VLKGLIRAGLVTALAAVFALPAATADAATRCPATFQVLHNDRIGAMSLPAGAYYVSVTNLTCAQASSLFAEFLSDYDGVLPYPWRANAARKSFTNGRSGFSVRLARSAPTPPSPPTPTSVYTCGGTFSVLHNDRIGAANLPKGQYRVQLLSGGITCASASALFARFLDYPSGRLPSPWTSAPYGRNGVSFANGDNGTAFRASLTRRGSSTGGGGHAGYSCGIFRVLHNDHVGSLYVPKGSYEIVLPAGSTMTCASANKQFNAFLDAENLISPWLLNAQTAQFTRGYNSSTTFRIDPVAGNVR